MIKIQHRAFHNTFRCYIAILSGSFLILAFGCASVKDEIDPSIQAELQEALNRAPTDELSKSYDPLSLLQKAENFYKEKNFVEAAGEYEYFLNLHPLHRWAPYAQYKLGLSYFHQIPTVDRDIEPVLKALTAFQKLLDLYNDSPYREDASKKIRICQEHLAEREFYIGLHYYKKSAYPAAIARLEGIVQAYPETRAAEKAMYYLALSHQGLGESDKARQGLKELLEKYPATPYREEIQRLLSSSNGHET
jgi:outer membrane protein assembly factor BamD